MGAEVVEGDVRDESRLGRALKDVDAVIHLAAAFRRVRDEEAVAINEDATVALGRAAAAEEIGRFIFASTNLVYSPGRGRPAREDDELLPDGSYGIYPQTKVAAERALRELDRESGLGLRWARDWPAHKRLHLVHHADVAQSCLRALRADGIDGATFNIADDAPVSALEVLELNGEPAQADRSREATNDPSVYTARDAGAL
jgi:nucleoside-diphosphate-sugar epimerase